MTARSYPPRYKRRTGLDYPLGDHVEEKKLEIQESYCPARRKRIDTCDENEEFCLLELGRPCELRMELIKEEKEHAY